MARTTYAAIRYRTKGQPGGRDLFRKLCCLADEYRTPPEPGPVAEAMPFAIVTLATLAADAHDAHELYAALSDVFGAAADMQGDAVHDAKAAN
jgi:hypothetical protein